MSDDFTSRIRDLDEAEQLLAACTVRGVIGDHDSHMEINHRILDAVRRRVQRDEAA